MHAFEKTARYWWPSSEPLAAKESVGEVAPVMSFQTVLVPVTSTCHWTCGVGVEPFTVAAAVKLAVAPGATVSSLGLAVNEGDVWTVSFAEVE